MAAERITGEQDDVDRHHDGADADAERRGAGPHAAVRQDPVHRPACCDPHIVREDEDENDRLINEIAVDVLDDEREFRFALVAVARLADRARNRIEEKRAVVCFAVVVTGGAEAEREDEDEECGRKRPPSGVDERRIKGRQVGTPLKAAIDPGRPRRVNAEAAEDQCGERGGDPPGVAAQRSPEAAFLQVADRGRHSVTAAIVCFTTSADFLGAAFSSPVSSTAMICSRPFLPSLHGTPQYIPERPNSPSSHAAQGSTRFLSRAIDSTIWTVAEDGA